MDDEERTTVQVPLKLRKRIKHLRKPYKDHMDKSVTNFGNVTSAMVIAAAISLLERELGVE